MIGKIAEIGRTLTSLSAFLEKEKQRVADSEGILKRLQDEKSRLEPIVKTQKETVDAIMPRMHAGALSALGRKGSLSLF